MSLESNGILIRLANGEKVIQERKGKNQTYLDFAHQYELNDFYQVEVAKAPCFIKVRLDPALGEDLIYLTQKTWKYFIPFNLQREWPFHPLAFVGRQHYATVRYATAEESEMYRNLALNSHDQHSVEGAYPHASATAETRGETVFWAKNAIDGIVANEFHGNYPYESWGVDKKDNAEFRLDFGHQVEIDRIALILRADYPHDSYWKEVTINFSDGSLEKIDPQKTARRQVFNIKPRKVEYLKVTKLKKHFDNSTFPALTQIEVYGR